MRHLNGDKFDPNMDRYFQGNTPANWPHWRVNRRHSRDYAAGLVPRTTEGPSRQHDRDNPKMRNFPRYNENISLAKTFTFTEKRLSFDLRFEAFNIFNRTQFGTPNTNLGDSNFGLVTTQANAPRTMQFAAKFRW